jgi:hypothetical protein
MMSSLTLRALLAPAVLLACTGCITRPQDPSATQPATAVPRAQVQPAYWLEQPSIVSVQSNDFDRLWTATEDVARDFLFQIDRTDYRSGLLTTRPMVSAQWFEPWRHDVQTFGDAVESSLATIRRTLRFEFERLDDGTFRVWPKVLVERQALAERRITSAVSYRQVFARPARPDLRPRGTRESDVGVFLPDRYWYAIGRDDALERALARSIAKKLGNGLLEPQMNADSRR